eukprot:1867445-Pyramimonas_sp.AAC.1
MRAVQKFRTVGVGMLPPLLTLPEHEMHAVPPDFSVWGRALIGRHWGICSHGGISLADTGEYALM